MCKVPDRDPSLGGKQVGWLLACWSQSNGKSVKVNVTMAASKVGYTYRDFLFPEHLPVLMKRKIAYVLGLEYCPFV